MKRNARRREGFSFTELMVAVFVLSAGLLPILWFFSRTNVGTMKTRDDALAWQYASELVDYATARGYEGVEETGDDGTPFPSIDIDGVQTSIDSVRFTRKLIVRPMETGNSEWPCRYRSVTAVVTWMAETRPRSLKLTGLLYAPK